MCLIGMARSCGITTDEEKNSGISYGTDRAREGRRSTSFVDDCFVKSLAEEPSRRVQACSEDPKLQQQWKPGADKFVEQKPIRLW